MDYVPSEDIETYTTIAVDELARLRGIESALRHLLSFDSTIPDIEYTRRCGCDYCKAVESARIALEGES